MSAKSRLTANRIAELRGSVATSNQNGDGKRPRREQVRARYNSAQSLSPIVTSRIRSFYLLLISIPGYLIVLNILSNIPPAQIAHLLVPYSFLPLQAALLWGNFWAFTWVFMNTGRGVRASLLVLFLLSLRLQGVVLEVWSITLIVGLFLAFEVGKQSLL